MITSAHSQSSLRSKIDVGIQINTSIVLDSVSEAQYNRMTKDPDVIEFPDFQAEYNGGVEAFQDLIYENFNLPTKKLQQELKRNDDIHIQIKFTLQANGKIKDFEIENAPSSEIEIELERIINLGKWRPGERHGKKTDATCQIDIIFKRI